MLALLYDIHGNLPALDAVLADARAAGATRWLLGGDMVAFGARPREVLERLDALEGATWIRGNTDRWLADASELAGQPLHEAVLACRAALGDAAADSLARLPESAPLREPGGGTAWHASPVSDLRSFAPEPSDEDAELLAGVEDPRLVFGHTHLPFRRVARGVELVNPGSVGLPFDGDRRAAYALVDDDGAVVHRRVAYGWEAARDDVLAVAADAPWGAIVARRLEEAAF